MQNLKTLVLAYCAALAFWAAPEAQAATYEISMRQINPDGPLQSVTCDDASDPCYASVPFVPSTGFQDAKDTYLDVALMFGEENPKAHFLWNRARLFTLGDEYKKQGVELPLDNGKSAATIELFRSNDLTETDSENALVYRRPRKIADIEITVSPVHP